MAVPFLPEEEHVDDSAIALLNEINQLMERLRLYVRVLEARGKKSNATYLDEQVK